jgi:hypothetical protein
LPSNSNYLGTSSISDGTNTTDLPITSETKAPFLIEVKNAGVSQEVTGTAVNFTKIEVTKLPNKTEYYQKEPFDSTGIVVTGISDIGNFEINGYTLSDFDNSSAGVKTITVSYDTLTTTFDVIVICSNYESCAVKCFTYEISSFGRHMGDFKSGRSD